MDVLFDEIKAYIKQVESTASNKTQNFINSVVCKFDEVESLKIKSAFYSGYSYGWNDQTTRLSCAGRYPSDEELISVEIKED